MPTLEAILARCEDYGDCRLWTGPLAGEGREPRIYLGSKPTSARRYVYQLIGGAIPAGRIMGTTCCERLCLLPQHLKPMTRSELQKQTYRGGLPPDHIAALTIAARAKSNGKLTMEIAREIRASEESGPVLSRRLGIHRAMVSKIRRGEAWREGARGASVFSM